MTIPIPTQMKDVNFLNGFAGLESFSEWLDAFMQAHTTLNKRLTATEKDEKGNILDTPLTRAIQFQRLYYNDDIGGVWYLCNKKLWTKDKDLAEGKSVKLYNAFRADNGTDRNADGIPLIFWNSQYADSWFLH